MEKLARLGYGAKGVVYLLVGGLALAAAFGQGGDTTDTRGAMAAIAGSASGRAALAVVAVGLVGYVLWGLIRAFRNPEGDGGTKRFYHGLTAAVHGGLALEAARLALGGARAAGAAGSEGARHWSAALLAQPLGAWLLAAVGIGVALWGAQQLVHAWRVELDERLNLRALSRTGRAWAIRAGRAGLAARGVVFALIGAFLVLAAVRARASEARGVDGVLDVLAETPWALAVVAAGLAAYGAYTLVRARYRVIRT